MTPKCLGYQELSEKQINKSSEKKKKNLKKPHIKLYIKLDNTEKIFTLETSISKPEMLRICNHTRNLLSARCEC